MEDALVRMGKMLDFDVVVIDHAPILSEQPDQLINDKDFDLGSFGFEGSDSVIVLTRGEGDIEALKTLSKFKLRYVGLLASRLRARENASKLRDARVSKQFITSLRSPAGADIGAVTPSEIALSIVSDVVASKYGKDLPRKATDEPKQARIEKRTS